MLKEPLTYYFRFEDYRVAASLDEFDYPTGVGRTELRLRKMLVHHKTPKGAWLAEIWSPTVPCRFVLNKARRKFAHPTIDEAKSSFIARKRRQLQIYTARARSASEAIAYINERNYSELET